MQDISPLLYAAGELSILLLVACVFLFAVLVNRNKSLRRKSRIITSLRESLRAARKRVRGASMNISSIPSKKEIVDLIDGEIVATINHHKSLAPGRKIMLDYAVDVPVGRRVAALRHAILIAEKRARSMEGVETLSWNVLQSELKTIEALFFVEKSEILDDHEELELYKKRIDNLERFKQLYFDSEDRLNSYKNDPALSHADVFTKEEVPNGVDKLGWQPGEYSRIYDGLEGVLTESAGQVAIQNPARKTDDIELSLSREKTSKIIFASHGEMERLRNLAVKQHSVVKELKKKLYLAQTAGQSQAIIKDLKEKLEDHERFLAEAVGSKKLLEKELSLLSQDNQDLQGQLLDSENHIANLEKEENIRLQMVVSDYSVQTRDMLNTIVTLEKENDCLQEKNDVLKKIPGTESAASNVRLKETLNDVRGDLSKLQSEYVELESRYLEQRMQQL